MFRLYLIGAGAIAREHANAALKWHPDARLRVADSNPAALAAFGERYDRATTFSSARDMLTSEPARDSDVVVVAVPPFLHHELTLMALQSGRHVLCEKPLAMNRNEAEEMLRVARKENRRLGSCDSRFAGRAPAAELKRRIATGDLGQIYRVAWRHRERRARSGIEYQPKSSWFLKRALAGGGCLFDWGPYDIACLNELLEPVRVEVTTAWTARPEIGPALPDGNACDVETQVAAAMHFHRKDGNVVQVDYERSSASFGPGLRTNQVEGSRGAAMWDWLDGTGDELRLYADNNGEPHEQTLSLPDEDSPGVHERPLYFFLKKLRGEPSPVICGAHSVFNFEVLDAIYRCAGSGGRQMVELKEESE